MKPLIAFIAIALGCQQTQPSPLDRVPADAHVAVVIGRSVIHSLHEYAVPDEEARVELSDYLSRNTGVDLTRVEEVVIFATALEPEPRVGVVLVLPGSPKLTLPRTGNHGGVDLHRLTGDAVVAAIPGGVVLGSQQAVEAAIDVAQKRAPAIGESSPLAALRRHLPSNADFAAGVRVDDSWRDRTLQMIVRTYGVQEAVLSIAGSNLTLTLGGDPAKLPMAKSAFNQARDVALTQMRIQKEAAKKGDDVLMASGAMSGYHQMRRLFARVEPRLTGGELIFQTDMPKGDPAMFIPAVGVLSAIAIPAFMKYIRRSKTTEASMNVRKLADASVAYYEGFHKFPPSTAWTPARSCCAFPGGKCPPAPGMWDAAAWKALYFAIEDPFYYQYRYTSERGHFVAEARGDLNCDGVYSSYKREGRVDAKGSVQVTPLAVENDIE